MTGTLPSLGQSTERVEAELRRHFADYGSRAERFGGHYRALWDALDDATRGGKLFRPALVLLSHEALGGRESSTSARVAAAFELLHTAFLIHDDVIDRDLYRRGRPNVAGTFHQRARDSGASAAQAEVWADSAAILAGDLALSHAQRLIATADLDAATRLSLLDLIDHTIVATAAGELADVTNTVEAERIDLVAVIEAEVQKTAVYSFQAPLQAGAILAGAEPRLIAHLAEIGRSIGIAFQLVDDLLGVFGDASATGKSTLSDLQQGKNTALILHARGTGSWPVIFPYHGKADLDETEAGMVRNALESSGSRAYVEELVAEHTRHAARLLRDASVPTTLAERLEPVLALVTERRR